jgi:S-adenosylmethionine:tRNA ribosyltransferase-isomerase
VKDLISNIRISDYDYPLPDDRIAKYPLAHRDQSKLLVLNSSGIIDDCFANISEYLSEGSLMVFNNTRVVRARLLFRKMTGASIELFLLEPTAPNDYAMSFGSTGSVRWKCIVGNLKRWKEGSLQMDIPRTPAKLMARKVVLLPEGAEIEFEWGSKGLSFAQVIELCGVVPIPPYLNRKTEPQDQFRYQTIYALPEGSVAAPTAGLHFTDEVFKTLEAKSIVKEFVTLHVGAGTFKPVKSESVLDHSMHTEHFFVERSALDSIAQSGRKRVIVGTTTLRTLESLYWLGVKAKLGELSEPFSVSQWEPYDLTQGIDVETSINALIEYMKKNGLEVISASTQIMIVPGYRIRIADALVTNYHQPKSTLLLLVAALIGDRWRAVYNHALANGYRFLSYGDSQLLFVEK